MGRKKSELERRLTGRWIRWRASRALVAAAPGLRRRLSFYGAGVRLEDAASGLALDDRTVVERPLDAEAMAFVQTRCGEADGPAAPRYWQAPWRFRQAHWIVPEAVALGHTGRVVDRDERGVLTADGAPENWNRDKAALLRAAPDLAARALPVRVFSSYFHFMIEAALPLVAYFEDGARPAGGGEVILSTAQSRGFARATLAAIATRYGAELRWLGPREKLRCAEVVLTTRESPCSDWFPARRATADALRDAILAAHGRRIDPSARRRLFLRRGREKLRNLANADALDRLAAEAGFEAFEPASENLAEQVGRMAEAEAVLAVHGAALANLLFARPGAPVGEIFAADFCKSCYLALGHMLGLEHHRSVGGAGDAMQNFAIDAADAGRMIARLTART